MHSYSNGCCFICSMQYACPFFFCKLVLAFPLTVNLLKGRKKNPLQAALRAAEQKRDGRHRETDALRSEFQVQCSVNHW